MKVTVDIGSGITTTVEFNERGEVSSLTWSSTDRPVGLDFLVEMSEAAGMMASGAVATVLQSPELQAKARDGGE